MNILLLNDDGYESRYFEPFIQFLESKGHDVHIVCPKNNRSGDGYNVSLNGAILVETRSDKVSVVSGTPVDCTIIGVQLMNSRNFTPDIVIAGPNVGLNYGNFINYSGTVSIVREASRFKYRSVALSLCESFSDADVLESQFERFWRYVDLYVDWPNLDEYILNINLFNNPKCEGIAIENEVYDRDMGFHAAFMESANKDSQVAELGINKVVLPANIHALVGLINGNGLMSEGGRADLSGYKSFVERIRMTI